MFLCSHKINSYAIVFTNSEKKSHFVLLGHERRNKQMSLVKSLIVFHLSLHGSSSFNSISNVLIHPIIFKAPICHLFIVDNEFFNYVTIIPERLEYSNITKILQSCHPLIFRQCSYMTMRSTLLLTANLIRAI